LLQFAVQCFIAAEETGESQTSAQGNERARQATLRIFFMIPGEITVAAGDILCNQNCAHQLITVTNTSRYPISVSSHYHFYEVNAALQFDRDQTRGYRLDIPAGTTWQFAPGQTCTVPLVAYRGSREVYGGLGFIMGSLDEQPAEATATHQETNQETHQGMSQQQ
jgi:urease subunit beta